MDISRYIVYGNSTNPLDEGQEVGAKNEIAAKLHAAAFTADGMTARIWDCLSSQFVPLSGQPKEKVQ